VTRREVQNLVALAYLSEGIKSEGPKPLLRDLGSPNMVHSTSRLIRDLEIVLSPSRPNRLTDNGRQERWYRTAKQEEIYCYGPIRRWRSPVCPWAAIPATTMRTDLTSLFGIILLGMCTAWAIKRSFPLTTKRRFDSSKSKGSKSIEVWKKINLWRF
jgi:transposase InsO family protein